MLRCKSLFILSLVVFVLGCGSARQSGASKTFTNPLLDQGADPYSFYKDGFYYYTHTTSRNITIWKTKNIADLKTAERKVIYRPPANTMYSRELWAPQIQFVRGKWYVYFAADDGDNRNHRMYVLENSSNDPMEGEWVFKGKITDETDKWAIDGDVFEDRGKLYMIWSGWEGDLNGTQHIYIAEMSDPWTIGSQRVKISTPSYEWETQGHIKGGDPAQVNVNEGPQFLRGKDKLFIVYSASGCWTDHYTLGMLTAKTGSDLLDASSWKKSPEPVFKAAPENGVYAAGHNSFFKSPDGKEDWILYHANDLPGQGCGGERKPRAQKFTWNKDGTPDFGKPLRSGVLLPVPSE